MKDSQAKDLESQILPEPWKIETYGGSFQEEFAGPRGVTLKLDKDSMELYTEVKVYGDSWVSYQSVYENIPLSVLAAFLQRNGFNVSKKEEK